MILQDTVNVHLKSQFNNEWTMTWKENMRDGETRNNLRSYRLFKSDYHEEKYVSIILPRIHRSLYAKFRMVAAPLRLETGRYEQLEEDKRVCFNCPNEVESEEHVIVECLVYSNLRRVKE